ncbi:MAG: AbrB/MazE/SpoVT family DNA-binding domain-containing protein [Sphaerochaetaceae bacterium]|nr:AbrB/MazE/SpoVT family DNA-binding domain-containing protein [Sphaerochaetaceae bacterium]
MEKKLTHFMSTVKVGPKGQVVIPKEIREMFGIQPGDSLIMMADNQKGIAIHKQEVMEQIAKAIFDGQGAPQCPKENPEDLKVFAEAIHETAENGMVKL